MKSHFFILQSLLYHISLLLIPSGKLTQLWKITIFHGKIHYKCPFSIANCNKLPEGTTKNPPFSGLKCRVVKRPFSKNQVTDMHIRPPACPGVVNKHVHSFLMGRWMSKWGRSTMYLPYLEYYSNNTPLMLIDVNSICPFTTEYSICNTWVVFVFFGVIWTIAKHQNIAVMSHMG